MKVAIIGAGVSGLTMANLLKEQAQVVVYEKESSPGGLIRCQLIDGNLFHMCGGHVFNSKHQDVLNWFWGKFNRDKDFIKADRNSVVFTSEGGEIPYPIENHMYLFDEKTQKEFISDLMAMQVAQNCEPQNFEDFLITQFGKTLYEIYFRPYNEKVWRRDLKKVPLSWLEGKLPMPSVQEIIFNNFNHIEERSFVHSTFWYEKKGGSQFIADKLAEGLDIRYNSDISIIEYKDKKWNVEGKRYDKVVFCGNIKDMIKIIKGVEIESYENPVDALEYHGTTAVFCEIDKNPYSWIYQPSKKHESHRIICTGNFSPSNNSSSLGPNRITATVEFTDEINKDNILENLSRIPLNPRYITHKYNQYTYPIQDIHTRDMIKELKRRLVPIGFYFTGRFADWEYYNMDIAIGAAIETNNLIKG